MAEPHDHRACPICQEAIRELSARVDESHPLAERWSVNRIDQGVDIPVPAHTLLSDQHELLEDMRAGRMQVGHGQAVPIPPGLRGTLGFWH